MNKIKSLLALLAALVCSGAWADRVISFNICQNDTSATGVVSGDTAQSTIVGDIPTSGWTQGANNAWLNTGVTMANVYDTATQSATLMQVLLSWNADSARNYGRPDNNATGDDAHKYLTCWLAKLDKSNGNTSFTIDQVPFAQYDVYLYFSGKDDSANASFTVNGVSYTVNQEGAPIPGTDTWGSASYTESTLGGNVVKFTNQSGRFAFARAAAGYGLAAVQIVEASADSAFTVSQSTDTALLDSNYLDTGFVVESIDSLLGYNFTGIMSGSYVGGTIAPTGNHYRPANAYNARKVGDSVYVEYQTYDGGTKVVLVEFKLMTANGADHATIHAKAVGVAWTTANAVGVPYMAIDSNGTITRINGASNVSGSATIPLATTNSANGYGVRSIVATPINQNVALKNTDKGTGNEGAGNWNLADFKISASASGYAEGSLIKIKSISLAARSGYTPSDKIRINGIVSDVKTTPNGTTTGWEGTNGYEAKYTFTDDLIVVVGATYEIKALNSSGSVVNSQLCSRPSFSSDDYKIIKYDGQNHWALCVIDAEEVSSKINIAVLNNSTAALSESSIWVGDAPSADARVALSNSGDSVVTVETPIRLSQLTISGSGSLTLKNAQNLKFVSFNASGLTGLTLEFDCTEQSFIANEQLRNFIKQANGSCKFIFKGAGANGVTIDYGSTQETANAVIFSDHLVFDGGTHSLKYVKENAYSKFGANATQDNPTIRVTNGATLNLTGKNWCGWESGDATTAGIIRVDNGSTLNADTTNIGTFYWAQQFYLEPGSTSNFKARTSGGLDVRINGGVKEQAPQIYVPNCLADNANNTAVINLLDSTNLEIRNQGTKGAAFFVGENAKLMIVGNVTGNQDLTKYGAGVLAVKGSISHSGTKTISAGAIAPSSTITGNLTMSNGTTIGFPVGHAENTAFTLCAGTLTATSGTADIYVGSKLYKGATLTYDTSAKTVQYTLPAAESTYALTEDEKAAANALSYGGVMVIKGSSNFAANATITNLPEGCKAYTDGGSEIKIIKITTDAAIEAKLNQAALHFDASVLTSFTMDAGGNITEWANLGSDTTRTKAAVSGENINTSNVSPILKASEKGVYLDFGAGGSHMDLGWQRLENIKTVIQVVDLIHDGNKGFFLGDWNNGSGTYGFHRGDGAQYLNTQHTKADYVYDNGVSKERGADCPTGMRVLTMGETGSDNISSDCFSHDRNQNGRNGARKLCETIVFTTAPSAEDRAAIEKYLIKKWFGKRTIYVSGAASANTYKLADNTDTIMVDSDDVVIDGKCSDEWGGGATLANLSGHDVTVERTMDIGADTGIPENMKLTVTSGHEIYIYGTINAGAHFYGPGRVLVGWGDTPSIKNNVTFEGPFGVGNAKTITIDGAVTVNGTFGNSGTIVLGSEGSLSVASTVNVGTIKAVDGYYVTSTTANSVTTYSATAIGETIAVSDLASMGNFTLTRNTTLTVDQAIAATTINAASAITLTLTPGAGKTYVSYADMKNLTLGSNVTLKYSWNASRVISMSFGSGEDNAEMTGDTVDGTLGGNVKRSAWNNISVASGTVAIPNGYQNGTTEYHVSGMSATITCRGNYRTNSAKNYPFMKGYLDDNNNNNTASTITLNGVPFKTYDLVIYCQSDGTSNSFSPVKIVQGETATTYHYASDGTVESTTDTSAWGSGDRDFSYEYNTIRITGLTGQAVTITSNKAANNRRSCFAAIQVVQTSTDEEDAELGTTVATVDGTEYKTLGAAVEAASAKITAGAKTATVTLVGDLVATAEVVPAGVSIEVGNYSLTGSLKLQSGALITKNGKIKIDGIATSLDVTYGSGTIFECLKYSAFGGLSECNGNTPEFTTDADAIMLKKNPWLKNVEDFFTTTEQITFATAGIMPTANNTIFAHMGSKNTWGLFLATGTEADQVIVGYNQGTTPNTITTINVPNARTHRHTYIITKDDDMVSNPTKTTFTIYLDGVKWKTFVRTPRFEITGGFQVGSTFEGIISNYSAVQGTEATAYVNFIRAYQRIISKDEIDAYTEAYPYTSPNGTYERTIDANGNWISTAAWTSGETTVDKPSVNGNVKLTATHADEAEATEKTVTVNLTEAVKYEKLTLEGDPMTFSRESASTEPIKSVCTVIGTTVTLNEGAIDLTAGPTILVEGGKLVFDFSSLTEAVVAAHPIAEKVTGDIEEDENINNPTLAKIKVLKPSDTHINVRLEYIDGCYWVKADGVGFKGTSVGDDNGAWDYSNTPIIWTGANADVKTGDTTYTRTIGNQGLKYTLGAGYTSVKVSMIVDIPALNDNAMLVSAIYKNGDATQNVNLKYDNSLKKFRFVWAETSTTNAGDPAEIATGKHLVDVVFTTNGASVSVDGTQVISAPNLKFSNYKPAGDIMLGSYAVSGKTDYYHYTGLKLYSATIICGNAEPEEDPFVVPAVFTEDGSLSESDKAKLALEFLNAQGQIVIPGAYKVDGGAVITNPAEIRELASLIGGNDCSSAVNFAMPFVAPEQTDDGNTMKVAIDLSHNVTGNVTLCVGTSPDGANTVVDTKSNPSSGVQTFTLDSISTQMGEGKVLYFKVKATPAQ